MLRVAALALLALLFATRSGSAATIELTGTIRDFCFVAIAGTCTDHPDFESVLGSETGIVETALGGDKKPVYAKGDGSTSPTTNGATLFDEWYRDVPGTNTSTSHTIVLDNTITADPDIFTFVSGAFFPIDGRLFGNQGLSHNFHFTFELHTAFEFLGTETFTFTGDDDLWVFINDILAIDLGGVHGALTDTVDLSDAGVQALLGITPGETYDLDLFFAERHTSASTFRIDTSLALTQAPPPPLGVPEPGVIALMGIGLMGIGLARRNRVPALRV